MCWNIGRKGCLGQKRKKAFVGEEEKKRLFGEEEVVWSRSGGKVVM